MNVCYKSKWNVNIQKKHKSDMNKFRGNIMNLSKIQIIVKIYIKKNVSVMKINIYVNIG